MLFKSRVSTNKRFGHPGKRENFTQFTLLMLIKNWLVNASSGSGGSEGVLCFGTG